MRGIVLRLALLCGALALLAAHLAPVLFAAEPPIRVGHSTTRGEFYDGQRYSYTTSIHSNAPADAPVSAEVRLAWHNVNVNLELPQQLNGVICRFGDAPNVVSCHVTGLSFDTPKTVHVIVSVPRAYCATRLRSTAGATDSRGYSAGSSVTVGLANGIRHCSYFPVMRG